MCCIACDISVLTCTCGTCSFSVLLFKRASRDLLHFTLSHCICFFSRNSNQYILTLECGYLALSISFFWSPGKHARMGVADRGMEFDPIRQHRHFCPWIASTGGVVPGWQQVLSALQRGKEVSHLSPKSPPSTTLIEVMFLILSLLICLTGDYIC